MKKLSAQHLPGKVPWESLFLLLAESEIFYIVTGSFKSEENARSQADMLKSEGFMPEIVIAPNGFYRVSAMVCG